MDENFLHEVYIRLQESEDIEEIRAISNEMINVILELTSSRISVVKNVVKPNK